MSPEVGAAVVTGVIGILTGLLAAYLATRRDRAKVESDLQIARRKVEDDIAVAQAKVESDLKAQTVRLEGELKNRLRSDLRTEFMAEEAIRQLLSVEQWRKRSFKSISKHLGGFEDDALRQLLVRSGAVRFAMSTDPGQEWWGLRERNQERVNVEESDVTNS